MWFEPGTPAVIDTTQQGVVRAIVGGRFLLHEYTCGGCNEATDGVALYGMHLDARAVETAWVDGFHTG